MQQPQLSKSGYQESDEECDEGEDFQLGACGAALGRLFGDGRELAPSGRGRGIASRLRLLQVAHPLEDDDFGAYIVPQREQREHKDKASQEA